jgi:hypothetical protein
LVAPRADERGIRLGRRTGERHRDGAHVGGRRRAFSQPVARRKVVRVRTRRNRRRSERYPATGGGRSGGDQPDQGLAGRRLAAGLLPRRRTHRVSIRTRRRRPVRDGPHWRVGPPAHDRGVQPVVVAGRCRDRLRHPVDDRQSRLPRGTESAVDGVDGDGGTPPTHHSGRRAAAVVAARTADRLLGPAGRQLAARPLDPLPPLAASPCP